MCWRKSIGAAREQVAGCEGALQQASAELQAQRDELLSITRELETLRSGTAERARTRSFMEKRIAAIEDAAPRLDARIGELEIRATAARASRAEIGAKLARESMAEDGIEPRLKEIRTRNESLSTDVDGAEHEIERIKDLISELMREGAVLRGRVADLSGERAELASKIENAEDHGAL